jgi:hypothetical protein
MYYYEGSVLPIEWTDQHGCGSNSKVSCEIVLQYACEDTLDPKEDDFYPWASLKKAGPGSTYYGKQHFRSGSNIASPRDGVPQNSLDAATRTINDIESDAIPNSPANRAYGMQESWDYYQLCQFTQRNNGLYAADQQIQRRDQRGTRQNPNGNRHGFECPEERDYYPWWAPSPWIDIAVLSDSASDEVCLSANTSNCSLRCQYYMNNTMNFNMKGYCDVNHTDSSISPTVKFQSTLWRNRQWPNNRDDCENNAVIQGLVWYEISHSDILDLGNNSFVCAKTQYSRANQLGNARADYVTSQSATSSGTVLKMKAVEGVNANRFLWQVPALPKAKNAGTHVNVESAYKSCVLRLRYNISSADFQSWPKGANNPNAPRMVDSLNNSIPGRGSSWQTPLTQDPYVYIGPSSQGSDMFLGLRINTNQYSRTFQDRSFVFSIKPLPDHSSAMSTRFDTPRVNISEIKAHLKNGGRIFNVNVRGKRGNIVQTFPSVEYDFVPNALALTQNDMIHFQWVGSDYNPRRGCNNGAGGPPDPNTYIDASTALDNARADRSNLVFSEHMGNNVPLDYAGYNQSLALQYASRLTLSMNSVLEHAVCFDPSAPYNETSQECYEIVMRLAFLNQDLDKGSRILRQNKPCLTQQQINAIADQNQREQHPLNCAKINAKPYPYFDAGIMFMRRVGWFPFLSSRNNNFSNRQQIGILCVSNASHPCEVDPSTLVLQDKNPMTVTRNVNVSPKEGLAASAAGVCQNTVGPNSNAVVSCKEGTLELETFSVQEGDTDITGDGQKNGCYQSSSGSDLSSVVDQQVGLAIGLLFFGLFTSWLAYCLYNRYQIKGADASVFRGENDWKTGDMDIGVPQSRPISSQFTRTNPKYAKTSVPGDAEIAMQQQGRGGMMQQQGGGGDRDKLYRGQFGNIEIEYTNRGDRSPSPPRTSSRLSSPRLNGELPRPAGAFRKSGVPSPTQSSAAASASASSPLEPGSYRISTPRAKEFATSRTEIRKPAQGPKASDMI